MKNLEFRQVGAVLAGLLAIFVVTSAVDVVLHATGVYPPWKEPIGDGLALLATAYRVVISIGGCYLTARLAPDHPMGHALALGAIGVALSTIGAIATWNLGLGPHWYPVSLIVVSMPCAWVGGRLHGASAEPVQRGQGSSEQVVIPSRRSATKDLRMRKRLPFRDPSPSSRLRMT
ncbi:MAG TPA: hypothetical protein VLV78_23120 [Thermoanaerobaculia bacterium]|nr:hypothetical protein [Thermoanaerobaculia bacterium]